MKKKFLSVLLALCMVAGTATASPEQMIVQAAEEDIVDPVGDDLRYGNYQYQVQQDGTVMITKYYDDGTTNIVIPSEIDGKKVTSMGESAFFECENLTNIVIPNSVKCIEKNAFSGCYSLTGITIPDSVTTIGNSAFSRCYKLEDIQISDATYDIGWEAFSATAWLSAASSAAFDNDDPYIILNHVLIEVKGDKSITNFTIPDSVTSIAGAAFRGFNNLTTVTIPDSVKYIGDYAFNQCTSLTNVTIPDSVIGIGEFAFYSCDNLTNITIPASVMQIGDAAFYGTTWLDNEAKKSPFVVINNILIDGSTASGNVNIPNTVTYIAGHAFYENKNITSVTIPSTVTQIGAYAFSSSGIENVTIPASVTAVDEYAFSECPNLKNVVFLNPSTKFVYWRVFHDSPNVSVSYGDQNQNTDNNSTENNNNNNGQTTVDLSTIKPSVTNVTYTGKAQQPTVVITDTTGQTVDPSNYTLTYSNNKNVGQAAVTATGIGNYTGTLTAVFNIVPKGTNLSKVIAKKKSFLAKWKKQSAQTSGYELQYATNAKFKGAKIKTVKKNKTTSIAVKKLKSKKKYYVRVRTYKTVKINGKSMKLYSNWSKAKKVKVK